MSLDWANVRGLPRSAAAALRALDLRHPRLDLLAGLPEAEWREALNFTDRTQLTLPLRLAAREAMPEWVRERVDACAWRNLERLCKFEALYRDIDARLRGAGIEYLALKGLTHCP